MPDLIDTHTFIWFVQDSDELSSKARSLIESPMVDILISIGSICKMSIKTAIGKLSLDGGFERASADLEFNSIKIQQIAFA
jgi:PIN domain nuclease of toxin-antitoxin system